jgi:hypothetical protein
MAIISYIRDMKNRILLLCTASLLFSGLAFSQTGNDGKGNAKDSTKTKPKANLKSSNLTSSSGAKPCPGKTCGKKNS